jgi:hypothetical protein
MSKVMLRVRDLQTGDGLTKELPAATVWLTERPRCTEVLGVVLEGVTREENDRMCAAMRPLDEETAPPKGTN